MSDLPLTELPTRIEGARYFLFLKENKYASNKDVIPELSEAIIHLWNRSGIPTQSLKNVKTKLLRLVEEGQDRRDMGNLPKRLESLMKVSTVYSLLHLVTVKSCQNAHVRKKSKFLKEGMLF